MPSRYFYNTAEEADLAISGAYPNIIIRGSGFVRDTGVQNISGEKFFYDRISFYADVDITGNVNVTGALSQYGNANFYAPLTVDSSATFESGLTSNGLIQSVSISSPLITGQNFSGVNNSGQNAYFDYLNADTITGDYISGKVLTATSPVGATNTTDIIIFNNGKIRHGGILWLGTLSLDEFGMNNNANKDFDFNVTNHTLRINSNYTYLNSKTVISGAAPATPTSNGIRGEIATSGNYLYVCTGTNLWGRTHLTGWV